MDGLCVKAGMISSSGLFFSFSSSSSSSLISLTAISSPAAHVCALGRSSSSASLETTSTTTTTTAAAASPSPSPSTTKRFSLRRRRSFWPGGGKPNDRIVVLEDQNQEEEENEEFNRSEEKRGSWVLKILRIKSIWKDKKEGNIGQGDDLLEEIEGQCSCCNEPSSQETELVQIIDRDSFSKLLSRVSLAEAKLYAQMCYLGSLAYSIPKIKPENLLKYHGLRYVTSSVEKKAEAMVSSEKEPQTLAQTQGTEEKADEAKEVISASMAYRIAASAASYVQSQTRSILPFKSPKAVIGGNENAERTRAEVASFVVATNSLTAVVAAKEVMKQAVAKDFNSVHSSPCQWFICDDHLCGTRIFSIQGSETLASWQANLLFEPIQFEGLDVLVHRGIYEAAKGIYEQIIPEIRKHLKSRGESGTFRFTGHSLGGSLSLLINLMLIIRGEVPISLLLPVITFGSPTIMCGGDQLLRRLGLPRDHVQSITMHRDIVPRAFSCNYPDHVIDILRAVNRNFRNHPCLKNQKLLYAPMGKILILQPDEKVSPHHHLLPSGNGLYILTCPVSDSKNRGKQLEAAQTVFLNSPHPFKILSDKSSYGSSGAIYRDHDMRAYLRSVRGVIRQELIGIRKAKREHGRSLWWPLIVPQGIPGGINVVGRLLASSNITRKGGESLKRFNTLMASQHMHFFFH